MTKKGHLMTILQGMGYSPQRDEDGDIFLMYQMKHVLFMLRDEDEDNYLSVVIPQFMDIEEGEESINLAICNKMSRELKMAKTYVDRSFKTVSASCEFYYANDEALQYNIKKSLRLISLIRSQYYKAKKDLLN